jgi:hypothetical protein
MAISITLVDINVSIGVNCSCRSDPLKNVTASTPFIELRTQVSRVEQNQTSGAGVKVGQ